MMKKILAIFMAVFLLAAALPLLPIAAEPEDFEISGEVLLSYLGDEEYLVIPSDLGITEIAMEAFYLQGMLKSVVLPQGLLSIGEAAFTGCWQMSVVVMPDTITTIGMDAFIACEQLQTINLSKSLVAIEDATFAFCEALTEIVIPDSCVRIGSLAFWDAFGLTKITIPRETTSIAGDAFQGCSSLTIYCYEGSYAHEYAEDTSIPYVLLEEEEEPEPEEYTDVAFKLLSTKVVVNGEVSTVISSATSTPIATELIPKAGGGKTMIPLRCLATVFGADSIEWIGEMGPAGGAKIVIDGYKLEMPSGVMEFTKTNLSTEVTETIVIQSGYPPVQLIGYDMYIPLRTVTEALGYKVDWQGQYFEPNVPGIPEGLMLGYCLITSNPDAVQGGEYFIDMYESVKNLF